MSKQMRAICAAALMLFLCACMGEQNSDPYNSLMGELKPSETPDSTSTRTLSLMIPEPATSFNYLYNMAAAYMAEHQDVAIQIETFVPGGDHSELVTRLMAGSAPDVLATYVTPNVLESGHLIDLYPYMNNDPDFREEDYYMDVITAMETNGRLYALPYNFFYVGTYAMRADLDPAAAARFEEAERVTYADMVGLYQEIGAERDMQFYETFGPDNVFTYYLDSVIDLENKTCNFQDDELASVLEAAKLIPHPNVTYSVSDGMLVMSPGGSTLAIERQRNPASPYLFSECDLIFDPELLFPYEGKLYTHPRTITSAGGKRLFEIYTNLMITDSCEDKELAWDFIKFCMADHTEPFEGFNNDLIGGRLSVGYWPTTNRNTYEYQCYMNVEGKYDMSIDAGLTPLGDREQVINDAVEYLLQLPDYLERATYQYYPAGEIMWEDACLYYLDRQSIDMTLTNIQSKVQLYLNE